MRTLSKTSKKWIKSWSSKDLDTFSNLTWRKKQLRKQQAEEEEAILPAQETAKQINNISDFLQKYPFIRVASSSIEALFLLVMFAQLGFHNKHVSVMATKDEIEGPGLYLLVF